MNEKNRLHENELEQVVGGRGMGVALEQGRENTDPTTLPHAPGELRATTLEEKIGIENDLPFIGLGKEQSNEHIGSIEM